jgi:hypothetical protein
VVSGKVGGIAWFQNLLNPRLNEEVLKPGTYERHKGECDPPVLDP